MSENLPSWLWGKNQIERVETCGKILGVDTKYLLNSRLTYLKTCYKVESLSGHAGGQGDSLDGGSVSLGAGFES